MLLSSSSSLLWLLYNKESCNYQQKKNILSHMNDLLVPLSQRAVAPCLLYGQA